MKKELITKEYLDNNSLVHNLIFNTNEYQAFDIPTRGAALIFLTSNTGEKKVFDIVHFHNNEIVKVNRMQDELLYYGISDNKLSVTCSVNWSFGICIINR